MAITDFSYYRQLTEQVVRDRKWIVAMDVLVPAAAQAEILLEHGAQGVLVIGASRGSGDLPDVARIPQFDLGVRGEDMMSSIRKSQDALAAVPANVQAAIDAFDPEREARVIVTHFSDGRPVGGRPVYAPRLAHWQSLEDKTTSESLWVLADVEHAPVEVVAATLDDLRGARERVGRGAKVVLSGDNREGFNGGASYVRWIATDAHLEDAANFFSAHCHRVRVMPFLEGVPCSIQGIVFDDTVIALRPCEMVVMRDSAAGRFVYASIATFWQPAAAVVRDMRAVARRVGRVLQTEHGYRGTFTVDGVVTPAGFRPTELNPRFGAALSSMSRGLQECSLYLLNLAIAAGEPFDFRPAELERLILEQAEAHPCGGGAHSTSVSFEGMTEGGLLLEPGNVQLVAAGQPADATYSLGPAEMGGRCRVDLDPLRTPRGSSSAPAIARALTFLGEHYGLGFPAMEVGAQQ